MKLIEKQSGASAIEMSRTLGFETSLASRLGTTRHVSILRWSLCRIMQEYPSDAENLEDYLVDVANARGALVFRRTPMVLWLNGQPPESRLSNESLIVGLCHPGGRDRPQVLRLAAQFISSDKIQVERLVHIARQERSEAVFAAMTDQALKICATHEIWRQISLAFSNIPLSKTALIHWSRIAEPIREKNRAKVRRWQLHHISTATPAES